MTVKTTKINTYLCDHCHKETEALGFDKPKGWVLGVTGLYSQQRFFGTIGKDFCSVDCALHALRETLDRAAVQ